MSSIAFLRKMKILKEQVDFVRRKIGFTNCFIVNSVGRRGVLALLWQDIFSLEIVNFSDYHIHSIIREHENVDG